MRFANILGAILLILLSLPAAAEQTAPFKAAAVEFNPIFKEREQNFPAMERAVEEAAKNGAKLVLFPEMSTTGYLFGSREEVAPFVDTIPGKTTAFFEEVAKKNGVFIVVGMPETDSATGRYYNAAFLVGPDGLVGNYRKKTCFCWNRAGPTRAIWVSRSSTRRWARSPS